MVNGRGAEPFLYIGRDALGQCAGFLAQRGIASCHLVADANTWRALGQRAHDVLAGAGCSARPVVLEGTEIAADQTQILTLLLAADPPPEAYVAVGSGTITDVTRFVSHRLARPFVSLPTAPSVDAYTSNNAPLIVRGVKRTIAAQMPAAVFADVETLCQAPAPMIAAGLGDMLGKYTCLADWRLGHLLWDEPYDAAVAAEARAALDAVAMRAQAIGRHEPEAIAALTRGLFASGLAISRLGNSAPASGSEHHLSHFWEMRLLSEGRPALLHGAKVGVATVLMAAAYARLAGLTGAEVAALAQSAPIWTAQAQMSEIRAVYGPLAETVIGEHAPFIRASAERQAEMRARIVQRWDEIRELMAGVPKPRSIARLLAQAGGPTRPEGLGLHGTEIVQARWYAHYLRNRFTVRKLEVALGLEPAGDAP